MGSGSGINPFRITDPGPGVKKAQDLDPEHCSKNLYLFVLHVFLLTFQFAPSLFRKPVFLHSFITCTIVPWQSKFV
jgi:hypothetical protein